MDPVTGIILAALNSGQVGNYIAIGYGVLLAAQKLCDSLKPVVDATATDRDNKALAAVQGVLSAVSSFASFFALRGKK
jgi:hypothetical protein